MKMYKSKKFLTQLHWREQELHSKTFNNEISANVEAQKPA